MRNSLQQKVSGLRQGRRLTSGVPASTPYGAADKPQVEPVGATPDSVFDIRRLIYDANTIFNPLHKESLFECKAVGVRDGFVLYNLALPCDMSRFFMSLMESMVGFFRVLDIKSRSAAAESRCIDPEVIEKRKKASREYTETVCSLFDGFVAEGRSMNDSIKLTNSALKAENHPWATYGLVSGTLRTAGKLRKNKPGKETRS
jgi:hypothetical protein